MLQKTEYANAPKIYHLSVAKKKKKDFYDVAENEFFTSKIINAMSQILNFQHLVRHTLYLETPVIQQCSECNWH